MVKGPPGTSTSAGSRSTSGGGGGGSAACSTGAPRRSWWVMSIVSSCCCSCWAIIPKANPPVTSGALEKVAFSSRSSTRPRTSPA